MSGLFLLIFFTARMYATPAHGTCRNQPRPFSIHAASTSSLDAMNAGCRGQRFLKTKIVMINFLFCFSVEHVLSVDIHR